MLTRRSKTSVSRIPTSPNPSDEPRSRSAARQKSGWFPVVATSVFAASALLGALAVGGPASLDHAADLGGHAAWISTAETVAEQVSESDLAVRVQVVDQAPSRTLWSPVPLRAQQTEDRSPFVFTDTQVEVLEVYGGDVEVGDRLWVLQTGGLVEGLRAEVSKVELAEDPLFAQGEEMVLFLLDISGDPVHAPDSALFRAINPASRYLVEGGLASRVGAERVATDLDALESEIRTAVAARAALERG